MHVVGAFSKEKVFSKKCCVVIKVEELYLNREAGQFRAQ